MKTILFLDDNPERHQIFEELTKDSRNDIIHVWTPDEFRHAVRTNDIDVMFLDHDLGDFTLPEDCAYPEEVDNGEDLCIWLRDHSPRTSILPKEVIIHSHNPTGALAMRRVLIEAGMAPVNVKLIPFSNVR